MRRTGMFIVCLGWPVRRHPLPSKTSLPIFSLGRGRLYTDYLTDVKSVRILVSLIWFLGEKVKLFLGKQISLRFVRKQRSISKSKRPSTVLKAAFDVEIFCKAIVFIAVTLLSFYSMVLCTRRCSEWHLNNSAYFTLPGVAETSVNWPKW